MDYLGGGSSGTYTAPVTSPLTSALTAQTGRYKPGNPYGYTPPQKAGKNSIAAQIKAAAPLLGGAYGNLASILASQGATDPRLLNQEITGIGRGTEANQQGIQGQLASQGLQNSGLGQVLSAAAGQAGVENIAEARAKDAALQEQRKREDLILANEILTKPGQHQYELAIQKRANEEAAKAASRAQRLERKKLLQDTIFKALNSAGVGAGG